MKSIFVAGTKTRKTDILLRLKFWLRGVMHTEESNFSIFVIEYLGEIETEFENSLFIKGPDGFEAWKKLDVENLVTHSL